MKFNDDERPKSATNKKVNPNLYKSSFAGEDSDQDEFHITKPFEYSPDLHHQVLYNPVFESDESFCSDE